jgi:predicted dehydrogenase
MKKKTRKEISRRRFLRQSAVAAAGFTIVPRYVLGGPGYTAPSDRVNIAAIGVGGKGDSNIRWAAGWDETTGKAVENVVALCDVDDAMGVNSYKRFPDAARFKDFRKMLDARSADIDAVIVSTPDHTHAVAALAAMELGKHVYVEKPLTHNIYEARMLTETARRKNLVTQMGNQGSSGDDIRRICEWVWAGTIGEVREVHCWTNRPIWAQGIPRPTEQPSIPDTLDWGLWLGPAPERPFHPTYHPFGWRGWWDFGTGALGDMGCHIIDPAFKALKLGYPTSVEASTATRYVENWNRLVLPESAPISSMLHIEFPAREGMPPVVLHWYDGGMLPPRPAELRDDELMGDWDGGVLLVGDKGKIMCGTYGRNPTLLPSSLMEDFEEPAPTVPRVEISHQRNWIEAIKGGPAPSSAFDYAGPFTETVLMGNLALRSLDIQEVRMQGDREIKVFTGYKKLLWDGENMRITNYEPANQFVKREYRQGW